MRTPVLFLTAGLTLWGAPTSAQQVAHPVGGPNTSTMNEIASWNSLYGDKLREGAAGTTDNRTGPMTIGGAALTGVSQPGQTAEDILRRVSGAADYPQYDAVRGVTVLTPGSTIQNGAGVGGYVRNQVASVSGGLARNGVPLFGVITCEVDNCASWGTNLVLMDSDTYGHIGGIGRSLAAGEADFNVMNTSTQLVGWSLTGASLAQPYLATGYTCNALEQNTTPKLHPIHWTTCFNTSDGASDVAFAIGAQTQAATANSGSQAITWNYWDASSHLQTYILNATAGTPTALALYSADGSIPANFGFTGNLYMSAGTGIYFSGQNAFGIDGSHNLYVGPDPFVGTIFIGNAGSQTIMNGHLASNINMLAGTNIEFSGQNTLGVDASHNAYLAADPLITSVFIGNAASKTVLNGLAVFGTGGSHYLCINPVSKIVFEGTAPCV